MFHKSRLVASLVLMGALAVPIAVSARPLPQEEHHDRDWEREHHRYYDREHRVYHAWDAREDAAYRRWLAERHYRYMEFGRLKAERQREYWIWRHEHPDVR